MGKKATKQTKKFASSGQLKKVIQARHKHQQIQKRTQGKRGVKDRRDKPKVADVEGGDEHEETEHSPPKKSKGYGLGYDV